MKKLIKSEYTILVEGKFTRWQAKKSREKGIMLTSKFNKEFEVVDTPKVNTKKGDKK